MFCTNKGEDNVEIQKDLALKNLPGSPSDEKLTFEIAEKSTMKKTLIWICTHSRIHPLDLGFATSRLVGGNTALRGHLVWWWPNFSQAKEGPRDDHSRPLLEARDWVSGWKHTGGGKTWFDGRRFLFFFFPHASSSSSFQNNRCAYRPLNSMQARLLHTGWPFPTQTLTYPQTLLI